METIQYNTYKDRIFAHIRGSPEPTTETDLEALTDIPKADLKAVFSKLTRKGEIAIGTDGALRILEDLFSKEEQKEEPPEQPEKEQSDRQFLTIGLDYIARGWCVLPLKPHTKIPLTSHGVYDASKDRMSVKASWAKPPRGKEYSNIGIRTGAESGIFVLDIDNRESWEQIKEWGIPENAPIVQTSKGFHVYLRCEKEGMQKRMGVLDDGLPDYPIVKGIDIIGNDSYVVAPPSIHPSGIVYSWVNLPPPGEPIPEMPEWLGKILSILEEREIVIQREKEEKYVEGEFKQVSGPLSEEMKDLGRAILAQAQLRGEPGARDNQCYIMGRMFQAAGFPINIAHKVAQVYQKGVKQASGNPFTEADARKCIKSSYSKPPKKARYEIELELGRGGEIEEFFPGKTEKKQLYDPKWGDEGEEGEGEPTLEAKGLPDRPIVLVDDKIGRKKVLLSTELSDLGVFKTFKALYPQEFYHSEGLGWLYWVGTHWESYEADKCLEVAIYKLLYEIHDVAKKVGREKLKKFANSSTYKMRAVKAVCKAQMGLPEIKSLPPNLIPCRNGIYDIIKEELLPHSRDYLLTYNVPTNFNPEADMSDMYSLLFSVVGGEENQEEVIEYLQRKLGYSCTGYINEETIDYIVGPPRSGKGSLFETINAVFEGSGLYKEVEFKTFEMRKNADSQNFDLFGLRNSRFLASSESERRARLNVTRLKNISGGNPIRCARKFKDFIEFKPTWHIWLSSNWEANIDPDDLAAWGRFNIIWFPNSFLGKENKVLKESLRTEANREAMLLFLIIGATKWKKSLPRGIIVPNIIKKWTSECKMAIDSVGLWLEECCDVQNQDERVIKSTKIEPGDYWSSGTEIMASYINWCDRHNVNKKTRRGLMVSLKVKGFDIGIKDPSGYSSKRGVLGINICESSDE